MGKMMIKAVFALLLSIVLYGCASNERINENQICTNNAFKNFPVNLTPQNYTEIEYYQRQEGTTCTPIPRGLPNAGGMECQPNMRTYQRQVQKTRNVDSNENQRSEFIEKCTNRQCLIKYGNTSCKAN